MAVHILHDAIITGELKVGSSIRDTTDIDTGFDFPGGNVINMVSGNTTRASVTATAFNIEVPAIINNTLELNNGLIDINQSQGTNGQVLSSKGAGNGVDWIDLPTDNNWYVTGATFSSGTLNITGNNGAVGASVSLDGRYALLSHTHDDRYYTETEIGNFFSGTTAITGYSKTNWDSAYTYSQVGHLPLAGGTLSGDLTVNGGDIILGGTGRIQGVDTVSANTDAANKLYVDNAISGVVDNNWYVTGGSFSTANGDLTITGNNAAVGATISLDGRYLLTSGTAANSQLLDSLDSTQFLRSDAADTASGLITFTGGARFGAGVTLTESTDRADLLYVNSSTTTWGGLQIGNTNNEFIFSLMGDGNTGGIYDDVNSEWLIFWSENGSVQLNYDGGIRLITTSDGISVGGVVTADGGTSTEWNTAYDNSIVSAGVTGTSTKTLTLNQQDGGTVQASWTDEGNVNGTGATNYLTYWDTADTIADTNLYYSQFTGVNFTSFSTYRVGARFLYTGIDTYKIHSEPTYGGLVIKNETDVRNEMVFDGTGNVGIGTVTPDYKLDVAGDIGIDDYVYHNSDANTYIGFPAIDTFTITTAGVERARVSSTGTLKLNNYGDGTITGTAAKLLAVDTDGNVIEENLPGAGVTGVTAGAGLSGGGTSGNVTLDLDLGELTVGGTLVGTDYLIAENGGVDNRQLISSIPLSIFNNDSGWTSNTGTVTGSGTTNYIPKFTGSTAIGDTGFYESGTRLAIPDYIEHAGDTDTVLGFPGNDQIYFQVASAAKMLVYNTGIRIYDLLRVDAEIQNGDGVGTSGQVLTSGGSGNATTWEWTPQTIVSTFSHDSSTGTYVYMPFNTLTDTTTLQHYNTFVAPRAGRVRQIILKNAGVGTTPTMTSTTLRVIKNSGVAYTSSAQGTLAALNQYVTVTLGDSNATFVAGDKLNFGFNANGLWRGATATIILEYT